MSIAARLALPAVERIGPSEVLSWAEVCAETKDQMLLLASIDSEHEGIIVDR